MEAGAELARIEDDVAREGNAEEVTAGTGLTCGVTGPTGAANGILRAD